MPTTLRFREALTMRDRDSDLPGPRPGTIAAGAVAVLILVGAGAVALSGGGGSSSTVPLSAKVNATSAGGASAEPALTSQAVVPEPAPLLVAPDLQWQLFAGVPLPYSRTAGPLTVDGSVYSGYERSQTGALIAAAHLSARYLVTAGNGWRDVLERQVLPGPGRDAFARLRASVTEQAPPGTYGQPAGFRFVAFTPDVAAIQLVSRFPRTGVLQVVVVTVRWVDGDWRLQLQPDGSSSPTAAAVPDLDGFVVWGA
jgi:hypothetical protein